jgi:hypothetical protein
MKSQTTKTIDELWVELIKHPNFFHGNIWTKDDVIHKLTSDFEEYLTDTNYCEKISSENIEKIITLFIDGNKCLIQNIMYNHQKFNEREDCWSIDFDEYPFKNQLHNIYQEVFQKK